MDPKTQAARIAHNVGESKRVQIIDQAKKANIRLLNPGVKKEPEVPPEVAAETAEPKEAMIEGTAETPATTAEETAATPEVEETESTEETSKKRRRGKSKSDEKETSED
jgi:hypothetical protein